MTKEIQTAFHAGELAPQLYGRVDFAKYHSAAALVENFFVDYRGGVTSRPGSRWVMQCADSANPVRLIPFQASVDVGYVLEFGNGYIRFIADCQMILNDPLTITNITQSNPGVVTTSAPHGLNIGTRIFIDEVEGMTEINNRYFNVFNTPNPNEIELGTLVGSAFSTTTLSSYTSGGRVREVYYLPSPYAAEDLAQLKFVQNVNQMILCHPDYPVYVLTLIEANNWSLAPVVFGSQVGVPQSVSVTTTLSAGTVNYSYIVTAVDANGQEGAQSTAGVLTNIQDIRSVAGTNRVTWAAVNAAASYNVYRAVLVYGNPVPAGAAYGFLGNTTGIDFDDTNIDADFTLGPPIAQNPFTGNGVASIALTANDFYATVPTVAIDAPPAGGKNATATVYLQCDSATLDTAGDGFYNVGDLVPLPNGIVLVVASVTLDANQHIVSVQPLTYPGSNRGAVTSGTTPANPVMAISGPFTPGLGPTFQLAFNLAQPVVTDPGYGYQSVPTVTFSSGAATAVATLQTDTVGYPGVPAIFQQRLVLGGLTRAPQAIYMSKPGLFFNFDITNPVQPDDAITRELSTGQLNNIKSMIPVQSGLIVLSDKTTWLVNGGSSGEAVTPAGITANPQSYVGTNDVPPIVANFDVLYVQAKGSAIRDSSFNFYTNVFTGTDISILSSHLFYNHQIVEWAWAEEPFKVVWAVRDDGVLLSCTFMKEQELIGWAQSITVGGLYKSVATITEMGENGPVDSVYTVVERTINGNTVKYIECFTERSQPEGVLNAWPSVDSGLEYEGPATDTFTGGEHLAGLTVYGFADGVPFEPFVMPSSGIFTLDSLAEKVIVGIGFFPRLKTLPLEVGEPTVQGDQKKITKVTVKVANTLGLETGTDFDHLVTMKDLQIGNVGSLTNEVVTDLVTGDVQTIIDPKYCEQGQYCFKAYIYPATILAVVPTFTTVTRK